MSKLPAQNSASSNLLGLSPTCRDANLRSVIRQVILKPRLMSSLHSSAKRFGVLRIRERVRDLIHTGTVPVRHESGDRIEAAA